MKITIESKEYNLIWGLNAITKFIERTGLETNEALELIIGSNSDPIKKITAFATFISCASEAGGIIEGSFARLSAEQVFMEIDKHGDTFTKPIMDDFLASSWMGSTVSEFLSVVSAVAPETSTKKKRTSVK